jgi:hypothetical protein
LVAQLMTAMKENFAEEFGVREARWSGFNVNRMR